MTPPLPPGAIRFAPGEQVPPDVAKEILEAQEFIFRYTVPIVVDALSEEVPEVGTGIVVDIGHRRFIATAGHVINRRPYVVLGPDFVAETPHDPTAYLAIKHREDLDIGYLEIPSDAKQTSCPFESLINDPPPANTLLLLIGHPVHAPGSLQETALRGGRVLGLIRTAHGCTIEEVHEDRYVFSFSKDIVDFNPHTGRLTEGTPYISPHGFSGGGIWARRNYETIPGLMHPGNMFRLYAIDYSWIDLKRKLNCVPIRYWVRLVYDNYPDLRDEILTRFPNIETVILPPT
jgi:hypothetical protein